MAQLTWQNVNADFGSGRSSGIDLLNGGFDTIQGALEKYKAKKVEDAAMAEVNAAMQFTDPDLFNKAKEAGVFNITKDNAEFFRTRASDLLAEQLGRLTQEKTRGEIAAQPVALEGQRLANKNTELQIQDNQQILKERLYNWNEKLDQKTIQPDVMSRIAEIQGVATSGNPEGALRLIRDKGTIDLLVKGGMTQEQIDALGQSFYVSAAAARQEETDRHNKERELAPGGRALREQREDIAATYAANAADRGEAGAVRAETGEQQKFAGEQLTESEKQFALTNFPKILSSSGTIKEMEEAIANYPGASVGAKKAMQAALNDALPTIASVSPEEWEQRLREKNPNGPAGPRTLEPGTPGTGIVGLIDQTEGGGDYSTLYGGSQKAGGRFEGTDVSKMTIGQLDQFANDQYGNWVSGQNNGTFASPFGRYQIVNSTLQSAAKALGLDPNTVFDKNTQDTIFQFLLNNRVANASRAGNDPAAILAGLRQEWAGLKNVDDATLLKAVEDYRTSGLSGLDAAMAGAGAPVDESRGPYAEQAIKSFLEKEGPLDYQEFNVLEGMVVAKDEDAAKVNSALVVDDVFGGQTAGLLKAMQDTEGKEMLAAQVAKQLKETYTDIDEGELTDNLDEIAKEFGIAPSVAAAFALAAPAETAWIYTPAGLNTSAERNINKDEVRKLMKEYFGDSASGGDRMAPAMAKLEQQRAKTTASGELAAAQTRVREAWANYAQAAARKENNPAIDDKKYLRRLQVVMEQQQEITDRINGSSILRAQSNASNPG